MSGTKAGGMKAAATNKIKFGEGFYQNIGRKGGNAYHKSPRGFAAMPREKVVLAGIKGGRISRRPRISNNMSK